MRVGVAVATIGLMLTLGCVANVKQGDTSETSSEIIYSGEFDGGRIELLPGRGPLTASPFTLDSSGTFQIEIYSVQGKVVGRISEPVSLAAGNYELHIWFDNQPSGVYFYKLIDVNSAYSQAGKYTLYK